MIVGVILAAGEGKRLRPWTWFRPKPLFKIGRMSLLDRAIDLLYSNGVGPVLINIHHLADQVIFEPDMPVLFSYEDYLLGTAGSLANLEDWLTKTFVVVNADTYTNVDIKDMIKFHKAQHNIATVFTKDNLKHNGGVFVFDKEVIKYIDKLPCSIHEDLLPALVEAGENVMCYTSNAFYFDCGTYKKLQKARKYEKTRAMSQL